ncbi:MAG: DUF4202 domain-containing protein [Gimesia chilikensis]
MGHSERMTDMLQRFNPKADEAVRLAIRAQHIERWKTPRSAYPMDRIGYLKWRKDLYGIQAETAAELLRQAGCDASVVKRVANMVAKKNLKASADTQLLEDVSALVFLEHYLPGFYDSHADYSEQKWIGILGKTWAKMSDAAREFVNSGNLILQDRLAPLVNKAIAPGKNKQGPGGSG